MYMCKVFPSNRKKLKKRKCNLHEISSASPKAAFLEPFFGDPKLLKTTIYKYDCDSNKFE